MDGGTIVILLAIFTLLAVAPLAFINMRKTKERMDDPTSTKSTLAADKSSTGKPADV
ncbi:hypothetical protein AB3Y40_12180 [Yoonia sp. R2331]|uniref:hypothetical protein n=1 Tax=Yoonia sp. R2331 TaxID=3237238 RepID=UPI0034E483D1